MLHRWDEIWRGEVGLLHSKFHSRRFMGGDVGPKTQNVTTFSKFRNIGLKAPQRRTPSAILKKVSELVDSFTDGNVLKFREIRSNGFGVMGV